MASARDVADVNNHLINLLREFGELKRQLGETNGMMKILIQQSADQNQRITDLEVRIRKGENRHYWFSGIAAAIGAMLGFGGARGLSH